MLVGGTCRAIWEPLVSCDYNHLIQGCQDLPTKGWIGFLSQIAGAPTATPPPFCNDLTPIFGDGDAAALMQRQFLFLKRKKCPVADPLTWYLHLHVNLYQIKKYIFV